MTVWEGARGTYLVLRIKDLKILSSSTMFFFRKLQRNQPRLVLSGENPRAKSQLRQKRMEMKTDKDKGEVLNA